MMKINYDYTIRIKKDSMDYESALKTILSRHQTKYSKVIAQGNEFIFINEYTVCPICAANIESIDFCSNSYQLTKQTNDFFQPQVDFEHPQRRELVLTENSLSDKTSIKCPYCGKEIYKGHRKREIVLSKTPEEATVKVEIKSPLELLSAVKIFNGTTSLNFEESDGSFGYEQLQLNAVSGKTKFSLLDSTGKVINSMDITEEKVADDICFTLFSSQESIKNYLIEFLKCFWDKAFPYNTLPDIYAAIELNRFKGFKRQFYSATPYIKGTRKIAKSFKCVEHLKNVDAMLAYLNTLQFPSTRRIKRALFEKQWLFFYLDQLESLYLAIKNIDVFRELFLVSDEALIGVLANLNIFPKSICFYEDFSKYKITELPKLINNYNHNVIAFSNSYGLLSDEIKQTIINNKFVEVVSKIKEPLSFNNEVFYTYKNFVDFSEPLLPRFYEKHELEDSFDGCSFEYLCSTNQTNEAGKILKNCLTEWTSFFNPVIILSVGTTTVAAVELEKYSAEIIQVRLKHNRSIISNFKLLQIFETWRKKHNIAFSEENTLTKYYFKALKGEYTINLDEDYEDVEDYEDLGSIDNQVDRYYSHLFNASIPNVERVE